MKAYVEGEGESTRDLIEEFGALLREAEEAH